VAAGLNTLEFALRISTGVGLGWIWGSVLPLKIQQGVSALAALC
jgi:hypothetical protein